MTTNRPLKLYVWDTGGQGSYKSTKVLYQSEMGGIDGKKRKSRFFQEFKRQKGVLNNTKRRVMRCAHIIDAEVVCGSTNEAEIDEDHCNNDVNDEEDIVPPKNCRRVA